MLLLKLIEPLARHVQQGIEWWGNEARVLLIFEHPIDIEETRANQKTPFSSFIVIGATLLFRYQRDRKTRT